MLKKIRDRSLENIQFLITHTLIAIETFFVCTFRSKKLFGILFYRKGASYCKNDFRKVLSLIVIIVGQVFLFNGPCRDYGRKTDFFAKG